MKSLPVNSRSALPNGESDLQAIIERIAPERRVEFLRWRERVKRHGENDELLAVVGYLDTSVVLMDLLSREAQPEAIKRALAAVEKASQDQAAATARIPRLPQAGGAEQACRLYSALRSVTPQTPFYLRAGCAPVCEEVLQVSRRKLMHELVREGLLKG
jgi:hypothetical protein